MAYKKIVYDEYILGVAVTEDGNITQEEYTALVGLIHAVPEAPDGYRYKLRTDLTWELVELPPAPDGPTVYTQTALEAMTNAELTDILAGYGITASMNKSNMIRLILAAQGGDGE